MEPKSTVVKSKSSNSAISKKSEEGLRQCKKKTRSNANFNSHVLKKRGVYVEKRSTKINLANNGKEVDCVAPKAPPRPRPGQKRFLASVLNILSKSTTGTQYPEKENDVKDQRFHEKDKNKDFSKYRNVNNEDGTVKDSKNMKEKFKSRILRKKFVREDKKKMVVLQSKKEIAQTPSNYSEWSYKDVSQNSNFMIYEDSNNNGGINIADELKNAVLEGRNGKVKKLRYLEDEPKTLVADGPKEQKNLYNFFVDLLETTISVYNVKAEYDATGPSDASKTNLRINESIANKLTIDKSKRGVEFEEGIVSPQHLNYLQNDTDYKTNILCDKLKPITIEPFNREIPIKRTKVRKIKTDSFFYPNNTKALPNKSKSVEINRKTTFRTKNDLISVLKQELELETNTFEEPKSIFQALRVMARNKKKISFDPSIHHKTFTDECVLKRPKMILSRKVKKNNKTARVKNLNTPVKRTPNNTDYVQSIKKPYRYITRQDNSESYDSEFCGSELYGESYHSLEVYGFDYEPKAQKKSYCTKTKDLTFNYHTSPSNSDFDVQDALLNPASTLSSVRKFSAVVD